MSNEKRTIKKPVFKRFDEIEALETKWLWPGKIPAGMLSLIVGDQETGKSPLTMDIGL